VTAEILSSQQRIRLSEMLQGGLDQTATTLEMMLGGEISIRIKPPSLRNPGVCVWLGMTGALDGGLYVDLPEQMAVELVKTLTVGQELTLLDEAARSALMEFGNVLASVFVGHFDQKRGLRSLPTPPEMSLVPLDMPDFAGFFSAELSWSKCQDKAEVLVGLQKPAIDILLA
jgi:CheY-specific phosphatase CheX